MPADRVVPSEFPYGRFALIVFIGAFLYSVVQTTFESIAAPHTLGYLYQVVTPYSQSLTSFGVVLIMTGSWTTLTVLGTLTLDQIVLYFKPTVSDGIRYGISLTLYVGVFVYFVFQTVRLLTTVL